MPSSPAPPDQPGGEPPAPSGEEAPGLGTRRVSFGGEWHEAPVLGPGTAELSGPAILVLPGSTLVVPPGWTARADAEAVVLER